MLSLINCWCHQKEDMSYLILYATRRTIWRWHPLSFRSLLSSLVASESMITSIYPISPTTPMTLVHWGKFSLQTVESGDIRQCTAYQPVSLPKVFLCQSIQLTVLDDSELVSCTTRWYRLIQTFWRKESGRYTWSIWIWTTIVIPDN